jgi:hypothetical protein
VVRDEVLVTLLSQPPDGLTVTVPNCRGGPRDNNRSPFHSIRVAPNQGNWLDADLLWISPDQMSGYAGMPYGQQTAYVKMMREVKADRWVGDALSTGCSDTPSTDPGGTISVAVTGACLASLPDWTTPGMTSVEAIGDPLILLEMVSIAADS